MFRFTLGIVIFAHGVQKMLGWFGGHGYAWTVEVWSRWFQFQELLTSSNLGRVYCSDPSDYWLFTRYAAAIIGAIMIGAIGILVPMELLYELVHGAAAG